MGFIYRLTNKINFKTYVGKTNLTVEARIREHIRDSLKEKNKNRPLYSAIRKYGINSFVYDVIEETENTSEREIFWIKFFGSYKIGYNATRGGEGKGYINYEKVNTLYHKGLTLRKIAEILDYGESQLSKYFKSIGICNRENIRKAHIKAVLWLDTGIEFESVTDAAIFIEKLFGLTCKEGRKNSKISECCTDKRKSYLGCHFKFIQD